MVPGRQAPFRIKIPLASRDVPEIVAPGRCRQGQPVGRAIVGLHPQCGQQRVLTLDRVAHLAGGELREAGVETFTQREPRQQGMPETSRQSIFRKRRAQRQVVLPFPVRLFLLLAAPVVVGRQLQVQPDSAAFPAVTDHSHQVVPFHLFVGGIGHIKSVAVQAAQHGGFQPALRGKLPADFSVEVPHIGREIVQTAQNPGQCAPDGAVLPRQGRNARRQHIGQLFAGRPFRACARQEVVQGNAPTAVLRRVFGHDPQMRCRKIAVSAAEAAL